jgi:hypothetical protein
MLSHRQWTRRPATATSASKAAKLQNFSFTVKNFIFKIINIIALSGVRVIILGR